MREKETVRIVAEIPPDLKKRVKDILEQEGMTMTGLLKKLLTEWLEQAADTHGAFGHT